jgi:pimeloyl-ACP methyl ester carboxylesterase
MTDERADFERFKDTRRRAESASVPGEPRPRGQNDTHSSPARRSGYIPVAGLNMYYELEGSGPPLVLLHAGMSTIDTSFAQLRPALAAHFTTIAFEQQAHGHTADLERPLRYEQMVEDTAAALKKLEISNAALFGWSDGGIVALGLAARHPSLVRAVATIGAGFSHDAEGPEFKQRMRQLSPDNEHLAPFRDAYSKVAPAADWPKLIEKEKDMYFAFKGYHEAELRALKAPLLVMLGDQDFTRLEHANQLFRMVPKGRLAVLPGTDHSAPVARANWVLPMLLDFFADS